MNGFLKYWDEVLAYWVEHGEVPASESCWDAYSKYNEIQMKDNP